MFHLRAVYQFLFEVILSASLYVGFFYLNQWIMVSLEDAKGVNWIFLPAGIRIFVTLIFDYSGAIGLTFASVLINSVGFYETDFTSILGIAIICGLAPLLGKYFVLKNLRIHPDLSNISFKQLLGSIVVYSLMSSGFHQIWFATRRLDSGSWSHFIAMFCGDVTGSILLVIATKIVIDFVKSHMGRENLIE